MGLGAGASLATHHLNSRAARASGEGGRRGQPRVGRRRPGRPGVWRREGLTPSMRCRRGSPPRAAADATAPSDGSAGPLDGRRVPLG